MGSRKPDGGQSNPQDSEYQSKRARNNEAVKRSREKARNKAKETTERVNKLKQENERLEERIKLLSKELTFLKDIFLAHAGSSHGLSLDDLDIKTLLKEEDDDEAMEGVGDTIDNVSKLKRMLTIWVFFRINQTQQWETTDQLTVLIGTS